MKFVAIVALLLALPLAGCGRFGGTVAAVGTGVVVGSVIQRAADDYYDPPPYYYHSRWHRRGYW
jgi:hypothetical protein